MEILTAVAVMMLMQDPPKPAEPPKPQGLVIESGDWKIKLYGFLRLDMIYDDSKPNDPQVIQFIRSEDDTAPAGIGAEKGDAQFNMHPKLTRFGIDVTGPAVEALGGAKTSGKLEIDFYGTASSESRPSIRMRHAYLKLGWDTSAVFAGQREDVISPLFPIVNNDFVMWNAGNLGDRRPQVRFEYFPKMGEGTFTIQAMIGVTGAQDAQNVETPGVAGVPATLDGIDSALPTFQVRAAYKGPHFWIDKKTLEFGIWGHMAKEELSENSADVGGNDSWDSQAFGMDLTLPLMEGLDLQAELWTGKNVDDVRGGIGQGVNVTGGDPDLGEEIDSRGGWIQIGYQATASWTPYLGYSFDDPDDGLPGSAARDKNVIFYFANRIKAGPVTFGADYLNWTTEWSGGFDDGTDNRFNFFAQYNF